MAKMNQTNLRTFKTSTDMGSNVRDTQKLTGEAKETPAERERNVTTEYTPGGKPTGPFGGENSGS